MWLKRNNDGTAFAAIDRGVTFEGAYKLSLLKSIIGNSQLPETPHVLQ
ncbi:MAG: hypothetical protein PHQ27_04290 [Victivallales bacterium]|nr:hypothetical protein [Victivallales bacterium]